MPQVSDVRIRLADQELMFAGVAELAIDGRTLGSRAWAPYAWVVPPGVVAPRRHNCLFMLGDGLALLSETFETVRATAVSPCREGR